MPLAEGAVEAQDELADEGPVRGVVIIAEDRELQPLRRETAANRAPLSPAGPWARFSISPSTFFST